MRLGLLGGTFDPIHLGHLIVAETVREECGLDEVWFITAHVPPHKTAPTTPADARHAMVELAVADNDAFYASRLDLDRPGPSYTEDTLNGLRASKPGAELFYIIGADMLRDLHTWRHPEALVELAQFVAVTRPGDRLDTAQSAVAARVHPVPMPPIGISSTGIREKLAAGKSVRYLVPSAVEQYIAEHRLYEPVSIS